MKRGHYDIHNKIMFFEKFKSPLPIDNSVDVFQMHDFAVLEFCEGFHVVARLIRFPNERV